MIASTAGKDKNRLDTGTLGWSDIHNQADYSAEHHGGSLDIGMSLSKNLMANLAGAMLSGANSSDYDEGTTQAGVSEGTLTVRDTSKQQQDIMTLNRDTDHANDGSISPIFNKQREQKRLRQVQLIGEIGGQAMEIIRTQGETAWLKAQKDPHARSQAREQLTKNGTLPSEAEVMQQVYHNTMQQYGSGSNLQKAAQAVTGALTALAGNNLAGALASGASPYLATEIKKLTATDGQVNIAANVMAHAVLGAVTAQLNNQSAVAGGVGAGSAELAGHYIAGQLFPNKKVNQLSEGQKQQVSALSTLAAGLAGGLATGDTGGIVTGAQTGKNAIENNHLSLPNGMKDYGQAVASWDQYAEANGLTPEQKKAGLDKLAKGELPESANIAKVIVDGYKDGVLMAGAAYLGPAATVGKAVGGAVIAEIANGSYQWFDLSQPGNENKSWDYKSSVSAGITGVLAPGRGIWQNVGIASGGALFSDGPDVGSVGGAAFGAWAGGMFGEYAPGVVSSVSGKEIPGFIFDATGSFGSELLGGYIKDAVNGSQTSPERHKEGEK